MIDLPNAIISMIQHRNKEEIHPFWFPVYFSDKRELIYDNDVAIFLYNIIEQNWDHMYEYTPNKEPISNPGTNCIRFSKKADSFWFWVVWG